MMFLLETDETDDAEDYYNYGINIGMQHSPCCTPHKLLCLSPVNLCSTRILFLIAVILRSIGADMSGITSSLRIEFLLRNSTILKPY